MADRVIFHVDANSAFLSWTAAYKIKVLGETQDIREIPSAVAGDKASRHSIILAKSTPAKKYGIQTGEPLFQALEKCPDLVVVPPDYELYVEASRHFVQMLRQFSPIVEQYSIDEAWVDMTGTERLWGAPRLAAEQMRKRIREELGFTVNVGISSNKLLAKMAGDFEKPNKVHTLFPEEVPDKFWPLPVRDLFLVGAATECKLHMMGIRTIGELAGSDPAWLRTILKKQGEVIWGFANGIDVSPVLSTPPANKGYGNSTTTPFDVVDADTAKTVLLSLSETLGNRLRKDDVRITVIAVGIRFTDLTYCSHQKLIATPTNITGEIHKAASELFDELWNGRPIRHLGIHTSRVQENDLMRQLTIFDEIDYEKLMAVDRTVDAIRDRFGNDSVMRAVFVPKPGQHHSQSSPARPALDHMSGGISREKREVDYSKIKIE